MSTSHPGQLPGLAAAGQLAARALGIDTAGDQLTPEAEAEIEAAAEASP